MKSIYGELTQIDIAKAINDVVEFTLKRGTENKVLIVSVRMNLECYKTDHKINKQFNIVYYRPSNYTFVGTVIPNDIKDYSLGLFPNKIECQLKQHSYHSSCWRYDGTEDIIKMVRNEMCKEMNDVIKECKDITENDYYVHTSFGLTPFQIINGYVQISNDFDISSKFIPIKKD